MGFRRQRYLSPIGVVGMATWLLLMGLKYMRWRGELDDEEVETIRRALQKTM